MLLFMQDASIIIQIIYKPKSRKTFQVYNTSGQRNQNNPKQPDRLIHICNECHYICHTPMRKHHGWHIHISMFCFVLMTTKFSICETVTFVQIVFNISLLLCILTVIEQLSVTSHMWKPRPAPSSKSLQLSPFPVSCSLKPFT